MYGKGRELDLANATNAIVVALLQSLIANEVLSAAEIRALLTKAAAALQPHEYSMPATGASGVILEDVLPQFPEDGGD